MAEEVLTPAENQDGTLTGYFAWCEGCNSRHYIPVVSVDESPVWEWNLDTVRPTFHPSILIREIEGWQPLCHSYIGEGEWYYLNDCTHALAGQRRPLKVISTWPEEDE